MKEKLKQNMPIILLLIFLFEVIFNFDNIYNWMYYSFTLCFYNLFPYIYPFMIVSTIILNYGINLSFLTKPISKLFKTSEICASVFLLSMISGCPSNAKYIKELYDENKIDEYEATKTLLFTQFTNPIFILSTLGITFLNDKRLGIIILISHYIGNIFIGIIFRNYHPSFNNKEINFYKNNKNFINIFTQSIMSTTNTLLIILGVISFCNILINILNNTFNLEGFLGSFLSSILEITQGTKNISLLDINKVLKSIIFTFLISFGGLSIHTQVFSIISNKKIRYKPYFTARLIHGIFSSLLTFLLLKLL